MSKQEPPETSSPARRRRAESNRNRPDQATHCHCSAKEEPPVGRNGRQSTPTHRTSYHIGSPPTEQPVATTTAPSRRTPNRRPTQDTHQRSLPPSTRITRPREPQPARSQIGTEQAPRPLPHAPRRRAHRRDQTPRRAPKNASAAREDATRGRAPDSCQPRTRSLLPREQHAESTSPPPAPCRLCLPEATDDGEEEKTPNNENKYDRTRTYGNGYSLPPKEKKSSLSTY